MNYLIKNKHFLLSAIFLATMIMIVLLIIYPTVRNILAVNEQIMAERLELESKLAVGLNIKKTNEAIDRVQKELARLESALIKPDAELELIQTIENLASENNLKIKIQSDFQKQPLLNNVERVAVTLETSGDFVSTVKFIAELEKMPFYYNVENTILVGSENTQEIKAQLTGWIYFNKP